MTITDFLLARIAEDEAIALEAISFTGDGNWFRGESKVKTGALGPVAETVVDGYIARHDPVRVLAECEAKRRIVDMAREADKLYGGDAAGYLDDVLRALAAVYADHPDYDERWRP